jgi:hypothetical protein
LAIWIIFTSSTNFIDFLKTGATLAFLP